MQSKSLPNLSNFLHDARIIEQYHLLVECRPTIHHVPPHHSDHAFLAVLQKQIKFTWTVRNRNWKPNGSFPKKNFLVNSQIQIYKKNEAYGQPAKIRMTCSGASGNSVGFSTGLSFTFTEELRMCSLKNKT